MKKLIIALVSLVIVGGAVAAGFFYWKNLRGVGPAIKPPPGDTTKMLPPSSQTGESEALLPSENYTEMPLSLPPGFAISVFAKDLGGPRVMSFDAGGNLLVSIPSQGRVVALPDKDGNGIADAVVPVITGLNRPHGIAWRCPSIEDPCTLYIAESDQVATYRYDEIEMKATNKKKIIDLPDGGRHFTRTLMFLPAPNENTLLISVGSSCDTCNETDWRRAAILSAHYDGSDLKVYAKGLRNSVFMATHPVNGDTWATEMGRDMLGDNLPPDEINIVKEGGNYGWPICYGANVHDTKFDKNTYIRNPCMEPFETPAYIEMQAHSAPLGLAFIPEEGWPQDMWYNLLVAYHGSWNRSEPTGYKIVRYKLDAEGNLLDEEDFISGWLVKGGALGRPVDIMTQPGGVIYISDDKAGVIYKVVRRVQMPAESKSNLIRVSTPAASTVVQSPLIVRGEARGYWFFEADFPVHLYDAHGKLLAMGIAQAQGEWMTTEFVPFETTLTFETPDTAIGTLILYKHNASGLPEHSDQLIIPVRFR